MAMRTFINYIQMNSSEEDTYSTKSRKQVHIIPRTRIKKLQNSIQPPAGWDDVMPIFLNLDHQFIVEDSRIPDDFIPREQYVRIQKANYKRTRELYNQRFIYKNISKELYQWIINQNLVDKNLLEKWQKPGFERLCCLDCENCVCHMEQDKNAPEDKKCARCFCHGCASKYSDGTPVPETLCPYLEDDE